MLDINPDEINLDYIKAPPHSSPNNTIELSAMEYPNPTKDNLTIKFNDAIATDGSIEIFGIMGNLIYNSAISKGISELQLNVSGINSGLYFYTIKVNNNKLTSGKITIINK
jgi:hypothetical protein